MLRRGLHMPMSMGIASSIAKHKHFSTGSLLWNQLSKSEDVGATVITPKILKIVPNTTDIVELEKQDMLIRRRRKLAKEVTEMKKYKPISRCEMVQTPCVPVSLQRKTY